MCQSVSMPQLICLSPQTVSSLVDSLTHFLRLGMFKAAADVAQFIARCPPPAPPPSMWFPFPPPRPRRSRQRRHRRRRSPGPTPKSSAITQLSAEVDDIIESIEQLPVKSLNQERIFFKKFDQDSLCATIAMLAKTYSPDHIHKPPTLAIEYQPRVNKSAEAGATPSKELCSALGSPPPTRTETSEQPRAMSPEACTQSSDREAAASAFVCRPPTSGKTPCLSHDCPDHCLFMYEPTQPEESGTGDNSFNDPISKNVKRESNSKLVHVAHPNVTPVSQSIVRGVQNLLAIAAESNITFKEDETMKAAVVETELQLAKTERGHVTGAQSTLSPAAAESPNNSPSRYGFPPRTAEDHLHLSPRRPPAAHYSHQVPSPALLPRVPLPLDELDQQQGDTQQYSFEEFDYNEATGAFSLKGQDVIFASPELKAEVLAQLKGATQSCSDPSRSSQPPEPARPHPRGVQEQLDLAYQAPANFRAREPKLTYGKFSRREVQNLGQPTMYTKEVLQSHMDEAFTRAHRGIYWSKFTPEKKREYVEMIDWSASFPGQSPPTRDQLQDLAGTWSTWA